MLGASSCLGATPQATWKTGISPLWVFADLDGDRQPDLIEGRPSRSGQHWRLELVSHQPADFVLSCASYLQPLSLTLQDIDDDSDLDLILRDEFRNQAVGWWVNDGSGHFEKGDPSALPESGPEISRLNAARSSVCYVRATSRRRDSCSSLIVPEADSLSTDLSSESVRRNREHFLSHVIDVGSGRGPPRPEQVF